MSAILEFADKLRSQVDIANVVGRYVELRRTGANMKGLCPFHNEKTPSFTVSTTKQIFHCFGCQEGGDVIKFVQKVERLEWIDAVRHLSQEFGIPMPEWQGRRETESERDEKAAALAAMDFAIRYFAHELRTQVKSGAEIRAYLNRRGIGPELAKRFHIGLAPDAWTGLMDTATRNKISAQALMNAGLTIRHATKDRVYDRFRKRLIFPIHDTNGTPIALGARVYAADARPDEPKYINSPESLIYHKGQALYALHLARDHIVKQKLAILMEGYMDVIRAHAHGITNCVASCGTALTDEQARLLKRFTPEVALVYDGDEAGQKAMLRGTVTLLGQGISVKIVSLPDGHDPDSFLTEHGADKFNELVAASQSFFSYFLAQAVAKFGVSTAEGKVQIVELLLPMLRRVSQSIARNDYVRRLADRIQVDANLIQRQLAENPARGIDRFRENIMQSHGTGDSVVERTLLKLMVECPDARTRIHEKIDSDWLRDPTIRKWFNICKTVPTADLSWNYLLNSDEVLDEQERSFLRSLAVIEEGCDSSQRAINHVATRLNLRYVRNINLETAQLAEKFFHSGEPDSHYIEVVRKIDENCTPTRPLLKEFFLKSHQGPENK